MQYKSKLVSIVQNNFSDIDAVKQDLCIHQAYCFKINMLHSLLYIRVEV